MSLAEMGIPTFGKPMKIRNLHNTHPPFHNRDGQLDVTEIFKYLIFIFIKRHGVDVKSWSTYLCKKKNKQELKIVHRGPGR